MMTKVCKCFDLRRARCSTRQNILGKPDAIVKCQPQCWSLQQIVKITGEAQIIGSRQTKTNARKDERFSKLFECSSAAALQLEWRCVSARLGGHSYENEAQRTYSSFYGGVKSLKILRGRIRNMIAAVGDEIFAIY